jgi:pilus assembly protein CpaE
MATEGTTFGTARAPRYRVVAVDAEHRIRTKLSIELAGMGAVPFESIEAMAATLVPGEAVVAVLGPSLANDTGLAHVARLSRQHPEVGAVLLVEELSLAALQQALRAGVRDAVPVDADETMLRQSVERVSEVVIALADRSNAAAANAPATRGRVVVAFSTKGGVGKSMVATNLASGLALRDRPTVIVDADLQFGDVAVLLGIPPQHTTVDAAAAIEVADEAMLENLLATHTPTGLRVLPAPIEPSAADAISPESMVNIVRMLRGMFDFVVIDMPPHFDDIVLALIEEADDVLLVASMDIPSIKNLKVGIQTLDLLSLAGPKLRLVLNRANAKVNLEIPDVERALGLTAEFRIPSDIAVPQAVNRGMPVVVDRPKSQAALALAGIADTFAGSVAPDLDADDPAADAPRRRWRRD